MAATLRSENIGSQPFITFQNCRTFLGLKLRSENIKFPSFTPQSELLCPDVSQESTAYIFRVNEKIQVEVEVLTKGDLNQFDEITYMEGGRKDAISTTYLKCKCE